MGGAILITVGVLFLLENYGVLAFGRGWPALLIVIGLCLLATHNASTAGHIPRGALMSSAPLDAPPDQQVKL